MLSIHLYYIKSRLIHHNTCFILQGSIPTEVGLLLKLTNFTLSHNSLTGTAPSEFGNLKNIELVQLHSNRITGTIFLPLFEPVGESSFVSDCGSPSAFGDLLVCENCTMCCESVSPKLSDTIIYYSELLIFSPHSSSFSQFRRNVLF